MVLKVAKPACEGGVLLGREVLVAEEDDLVRQHLAVDLVEQIVAVDGVLDLDAFQLGPDVAGQSLHLHVHSPFPFVRNHQIGIAAPALPAVQTIASPQQASGRPRSVESLDILWPGQNDCHFVPHN